MEKNYQVESFKRCTNSDQQLGFMMATLERVYLNATNYLSTHSREDQKLLTEDLEDIRAVLDAKKEQDAQCFVDLQARTTAAIKGLLGDAP